MAKAKKIEEKINKQQEQQSYENPRIKKGQVSGSNTIRTQSEQDKVKSEPKPKKKKNYDNDEFNLDSDTQQPTSNTEKGRSKFGRAVFSVVDGTILTRDSFVKQLPYIIFLTVLTIFYIANNYYAEKTIRSIEKLNNEIKELKSEYITTKSDYMTKTRQSEVAKALDKWIETQGIKESKEPPKRIEINGKSQTININQTVNKPVKNDTIQKVKPNKAKKNG